MTENYSIQYPILAYKTNHPTDNTLIIANVLKHESQKKVNIDPFRFVQFVETGLNPERFFLQQDQTFSLNISTFLLVSYQEVLYLMNYRSYPWPINENFINEIDRSKFQMKDQIQLLSGFFNPTSPDNSKIIASSKFTTDKILNATLLQMKLTDGVQIVCVLQLSNEIGAVFWHRN